MKKFSIAFLIGVLATVLFAVLAGFGGGACHCSTPLRVLFPYMSLLGPNADEGILSTYFLGFSVPSTQ